MIDRDKYLFHKYNLRQVIENHEHEMLGEIDALPANQLLNSSVDDLLDYIERKYCLQVPALKGNEISADQADTDVDVSRDRDRSIFDRDRPFHVKGTKITFFVPFEGDPDLFQCRPSTFTISGTPRADVRQGELILTYTRTDHDAAAVKASFDRDLGTIRQYLGWIDLDCAGFNTTLRQKVRARVEARREKLLKDQGMVAALGVQLRRRDDAPVTYVVPTVRRKLPISLPPVSVTPFIPEPALDMVEYEHILSVVANMVAVMERSPRAFATMDEESLRHHFLVQLNGQYESQATGETFNFEGKTDILIRVNGKNVFIAECKFWRGPESLRKALDQLLGYATWRDSKIALLVFNRGKDFSKVLAQIPHVVREHPSYKRGLPYDSETGFRIVFGHRDDPAREVILTVVGFEVPSG